MGKNNNESCLTDPFEMRLVATFSQCNELSQWEKKRVDQVHLYLTVKINES